jgi:hypothetical protein
MKDKDGKREQEVEYIIESGAVFIPTPGTKVITKYLPGATIKMKPSIAAHMLLNKARPKSVIDAEHAADAAAAKARAEALT